MKEKAPFWAERLPELPDLFYDSMRQHKRLQHSVDRPANELSVQRERQHQSRYLFGIGATLLLSGTALLITRPGMDATPTIMIIAGLCARLIGWRRSS